MCATSAAMARALRKVSLTMPHACLRGPRLKEAAMINPWMRLAANARACATPGGPALLRWCLQVALYAAMAFALFPHVAHAAEAGSASTPSASRNPLQIGTLVQFDVRRGTVGGAIEYLLEPVRYRLTHRTVDPLVGAAVLRRPLPPIAAQAGVMSIEAALLLLIGEEHRLVVDHAHRLIAIERMPADLP
jgi:hypothetical protein